MSTASTHAGERLEDKLHPELTAALHDLVARTGAGNIQIFMAKQVSSLALATNVQHLLETSRTTVRPELLAALAQTEQFWRDVETEFGLLTSTQVAERVGAKSHRSWASDARKAGRLIAVERTNKLLYPGFQFDSDGVVRPLIKNLTELAEQHSIPEKDIIYWMCAPTTYFREEDRPVDHLDDPEAVVEAADQAWGVDW